MFDSKRFLHVTFSKTIEQHYNDTTTRETEHALKNCDDIFSLLSDQYTMPLNQSANDYISFLEIFWHDRFFTHAKKIMLELHTLLDDSEDVLLEVFNNIIR